MICAGGDGWLYSFKPETGDILWKFDCNPKGAKWELYGNGTKNAIIATPAGFLQPEQLDPDVVIPMHCSGASFIEAMSRRMPAKLVTTNVGSRFTFGV